MNNLYITYITYMNDLIDFERRGEYVLADVKSATWFFECIVKATREKN
jgi:hypothetical protein